MKIIDNAISEIDLKVIQDLLLSPEFPWFFNRHTVRGPGLNPIAGSFHIDECTTCDEINDFQLTHSFYVDSGKCKGGYGYINSEYFDIIKPIIEKLECHILIRAKANLRTVAPEKDMIAGWHTDYDLKSETAVFYVNTNNGYTIFREGKEKIDCVENRLVIFPTELEHCGVSCTDNKQRVIINFNFIR